MATEEDRRDLDDAALLTRLDEVLAATGDLVIAFSGGADSALLAHRANVVLGAPGAHCVTAVSASLAPEELEDASRLASEWGLSWEPVTTHELDRAEYRANELDRCYHCKSELMDALEPIARARSASVALGVNLDDLGEHRPGQRAAAERGARFPLVEAGLSKRAVRSLSASLGLRTSDKPSAPCLASRVPHGTPVTAEVLARIARAESGVRRLGFRELRVRHLGDSARLELAPAELPRAIEARAEIVQALQAAGYRYATLDLEGLRSGNLVAAAQTDAAPVTFRRRTR